MKKILAIYLSLNFLIIGNTYSSEFPSLYIIRDVNRTIQNCQIVKCLDLDTAINMGKKNSFDTRIDALRVYQARQFVKVRVGQLLPSFNLRIASPIDWFDFIPNLLGFMFPSNWFNLKESRLHAKASEKSFYSLMSNQINTIESLYLNIHKEMVNYDIYKNHTEFTEKLSALMEKREEVGELAPEEVEKSKIFLADLNIYKISLNNIFGELYPQMGYAINLPDSWNNFQLKRIKLPNLTGLAPIDFKTFFDKVIEKSYDLQSLYYLKKAAKYSKRARSFEFLSPGSGTQSGFGFGYLSYVRIGKADQAIVQLRIEKMKGNLKDALYKVVTNYNTSLQIYQQANNSLDSINYVLESMVEDFNLNSDIDFSSFKGLVQDNIYFQWAKNYSIHGHLLAKAQLERLLLSSEYYENIELLLPKKLGKLKRYQKKEDKRIEKAIKKGELLI